MCDKRGEEDMKENPMDILVETSGKTTGALVGAVFSGAVPGAKGIAGGAVIGSAVETVIQWAGTEIKNRYLSKAERQKVDVVYRCAVEKISRNLILGRQLRADDFFEYKITERSSAEEIFEGMLLIAQREYEEKKIPYIANLYANIIFDQKIDRGMANQLLKTASELTYRQLVILRVIGDYQFECLSDPPLINTKYTSIKGNSNISIATEIYELYRKGLIFHRTALVSQAGMVPAELKIGGVGECLFYLMELKDMRYDDVAETIIEFLTKEPVRNGEQNEISESEVSAYFKYS